MKQELLMISKLMKAIPLVASAFLITSCGNTGNGSTYQDMPAQETDFITISAATSTIETSYPGLMEGRVNVDIKAQVSGYLEAIYVKEGQYVEKGESLFKIKSEVFQEQINNSHAAVNAALAAQANANLEVEKLTPLVEGKVISDLQLKTAQANYESAKAQVSQAKSALGSSKLNADFATIKAPVSGFIGRIPNRIGNLVTNDSQPLTTLSDIKEVHVYFSMSEAEFIAFRKSDSSNKNSIANVRLILADGSTYEHGGKLETASGIIDRSTGGMSMKAVFPNPDKLLRSGGAGHIIISRSMENVMLVPMTSVKDLQDKFFVFQLMDSNKVSMKPIMVSGGSGKNYLVKSGLEPGDKVAINRIDALIDGMAVAPKIVLADSLLN